MSKFDSQIKELKLADVATEAANRKKDGWHFIQFLAMTSDNGFDLVYSYKKDNVMEDLLVTGVKAEDTIASITPSYIAAFVFENEAHDLFGLNIQGIAIDFKGKFYNMAVDKPMSVISPEVVARKEKQAKIDAAMAAKAAKKAAEAKADAPKPAAAPASDKKEGEGE